jgi:predicted CXXCH cytochrome family protein
VSKHLNPLPILVFAVLAWLTCAVSAAEPAASGFGGVVIPQPAKPAAADECVEPVDVMRREHMNFLLHQRDETVLEGKRDSKYSLTGCMDCHNPTQADGKLLRYPDPRHFCADCHRYASVKIDCFECHADRGLGNSQQSQLSPLPDQSLLSLQTFSRQVERSGED